MDTTSQGKVNLRVDGSYRSETTCMSYGGIIRDNKGHSVVGFYVCQAGGNALTAMAYGLKYGLELAWGRGLIKDIICNVDCSELLAALVDEDSRQFMPIREEICELLKRQ